MLEIVKDTLTVWETSDLDTYDSFGTLERGDVVIVLLDLNLSPVSVRLCLTKFGLAYV